MEDRFPEQAESGFTYLGDQKNGDRIIKQLLNSVIAKYRDLSVLENMRDINPLFYSAPCNYLYNYYSAHA